MGRLTGWRRDGERAFIEAEARPGETWEHASLRLRGDCASDELTASLACLGKSIALAERENSARSRVSSLRRAPADDVQSDFFVPALYDVGTRDNRSMMDVAVFRLSKDQKRAGGIIRHDLPDGYVEVKAGADGMASVWDYDIVLMLISHLTEAMNRYRAGKGEKPGRVFRPHISEILKFCRKGDGSRQFEQIEAALARLQGTIVKSTREVTRAGKRIRCAVESEGLIGRYRVIDRTETGRVSSVEIEVPTWIYREVTEGKRPDVLRVHPDYFLIEPGIGRFIYRLARRAAGSDTARWSFAILYQRSGSASSFREFRRMLRKLISVGDLPEYDLGEEAGRHGPVLVMTHREATRAAP